MRGKRVGMHKRLGIASFVLVPVLISLNLLASWVFNRGQLAMPTASPKHSYVLTAMFEHSDGRRFFSRVILKGEDEAKKGTLPPKLPEPTTQPLGG